MKRISLKKEIPVEIKFFNNKFIKIENPENVTIKAIWFDVIKRYQVFERNRIINVINLINITFISKKDTIIYIEFI